MELNKKKQTSLCFRKLLHKEKGDSWDINNGYQQRINKRWHKYRHWNNSIIQSKKRDEWIKDPIRSFLRHWSLKYDQNIKIN